MYEALMVRYGELGLKGKNKAQFINRLARNMEYALQDLGERKVESTWGRIMVPLADDLPEVVERLERVFGIYSMSPVMKVAKDLDAICEGAYQTLLAALPQGGLFKVESRRADKTFPIQSPELSRKVAAYIFARVGDDYDAEMHRPQNVVNVEVRNEGAYVYSQVIPGAKGLPVGCSAKAVVLLSGGIDSPVASWMALKRGVNLSGVHFHSYPFTSERAKEKVIDLCKVLANWNNKAFPLHIVHFTEIQKAIHEHCPEEYGITILRRFMYRIAERIALEHNACGIFTGESLGQVASQTLESMCAINDVTNMPILRPLVGMDKEEITIRPYEDCCTVFLPTYPKIRPRAAECRKMEAELPVEEMVAQAVANTELIKIKP